MSGQNAFKKILVANRGEIATRVFRAATEQGLRTVAIYALEDRFSMHRFKADEAYQLNPDKGPVGAYLDIDGIVALAKEKGVDAIHPGYGFLSENPAFARAAADNGIIFIGPRPEILDDMGDKMAARAAALEAGVPVLPGTDEAISDPDEALATARTIGFPLIIKAAFGGGGRGMRVVETESDLEDKLAEAQKEAQSAFGNGAVFLERFVAHAKHIEVQILGDQHGHVMHLHERDCSVQRRHQKDHRDRTRAQPRATDWSASDICNADAVDDRGAPIGLPQRRHGRVPPRCRPMSGWFFIEMNPRIQVEHTVTEAVTGIDIVRAQIHVAEGNEALHARRSASPPQSTPCRPQRLTRSSAGSPPRIPPTGSSPTYGRIIPLPLVGRIRHPSRRGNRFQRRSIITPSTTRCW